MTRCTCTVFARSGKLHHHHCPKWQAYAQREQSKTPSECKVGKRGRIKEMMKVLRTDEPTPIDDELSKLLEIEPTIPKKKRYR